MTILRSAQFLGENRAIQREAQSIELRKAIIEKNIERLSLVVYCWYRLRVFELGDKSRLQALNLGIQAIIQRKRGAC